MALDQNQIYVAASKLYTQYKTDVPLTTRRIIYLAEGLQRTIGGPNSAKREMANILSSASTDELDAFLTSMADAVDATPSAAGTNKASVKRDVVKYLQTLSRLQ